MSKCLLSLTLDFCKVIAVFVGLSSMVWGQPTGPFQLDDGGGSHANECTAAGAAVTIGGQVQHHVVVAWNDFRDGTAGCNLGVALTLDGFVNVTPLFNQIVPLASEIPNTVDTCEFDPMTAVDPHTGDLYIGGVWARRVVPSAHYEWSVSGLFVARKPATATAFNATVNVIKNQGGQVLPANITDKPWMAAGRRPVLPGELTPPSRVYITYDQYDSNENISAGAKITWSDNQGQSWIFPRDIPVGSHLDTRGHLPRIGPAGELYISMYDNQTGELLLQRSFDGGESFDSSPVLIATLADPWPITDISTPPSRLPGNPLRVPHWPCIAVNPSNGYVYCVFFDTTNHIGSQWNLDVYFSRSTNDGATWSTPTRVANVPGMSDQFFPWCEVDTSGKIGVVYYDTRLPLTQHDSDNIGYYDTYFSTSQNDGSTWTHTRVTTSSWILPYPTVPTPNAFADYNGIATSGSTFYPVFTQIIGSTFYGQGDIYCRIY